MRAIPERHSHMPLTVPPALAYGQEVALITASGALAMERPGRLGRAVQELSGMGYSVRLASSVTDPRVWKDLKWFCGVSDGFTRLLADDAVRAIMSVVGGAGSIRVVQRIDAGLFQTKPKIIICQSDFRSVLLSAFNAGLLTFYGPAALPQFGEYGGCDPFTRSQFMRAVANRKPLGKLPATPHFIVEYLEWDSDDVRLRKMLSWGPRRVPVDGDVRDPLVVANLTTLCWLVRTGHLSSTIFGGAILLIEETDTATWPRFLESLSVLRGADIFRLCAGVAFGRFAQVARGAWSTDEVKSTLAQYVNTSGSLVCDLEFGHTDPQLTLPIGATARLRANGASVDLSVIDAAVG